MTYEEVKCMIRDWMIRLEREHVTLLARAKNIHVELEDRIVENEIAHKTLKNLIETIEKYERLGKNEK